MRLESPSSQALLGVKTESDRWRIHQSQIDTSTAAMHHKMTACERKPAAKARTVAAGLRVVGTALNQRRTSALTAGFAGTTFGLGAGFTTTGFAAGFAGAFGFATGFAAGFAGTPFGLAAGCGTGFGAACGRASAPAEAPTLAEAALKPTPPPPPPIKSWRESAVREPSELSR